MNNKNIREKTKRESKRSKECEQRKRDITNNECVKVCDEYAIIINLFFRLQKSQHIIENIQQSDV
jgi:hypothetical protein